MIDTVQEWIYVYESEYVTVRKLCVTVQTVRNSSKYKPM